MFWKRFFAYGLFRGIFGDNTLVAILVLFAILLVMYFLFALFEYLLTPRTKGKLNLEDMTPIDEWFCDLVIQIYGVGAIKWIKSFEEESHYSELMFLKEEKVLKVTIDELRTNHTIDGKIADSETIRTLGTELRKKLSVDHRGSVPELVIENDYTKILFEIPMEEVNGDVLREEIEWMRDFVRIHFERRFALPTKHDAC